MLNLLRALLLCLAALGLCALPLRAAAAPRIALVYNGGQDVFQQFAEALSPLLRAQGLGLEHHDTRNWQDGAPPAALTEADLLIAAGAESLALLARKPPDAPVLAVLLSRQQFEQHQTAFAGRALSAIYQDPPIRRQLQLAKLLLPGLSRVGYLYQPVERQQLAIAQRAAEALSLKLIAQPVPSENDLPSALVSVIGQSELLLASANSGLYNRYTIKTILTASYRQEKVLIGSSPAFVKAGSLATTYSSVQHIAVQVHEWITALPDNGPISLPPTGYARYFDLSLNPDVARSLDIRLPDNDSLLKALTAVERTNEAAGVDHE